MKRIFNIIGISAIILFHSCKESKKIDLGNDYKYWESGVIIDYTGYPGDGIFHKGIPSISPAIKNYKYDEDYITVKQQYNKEYSSSLMKSILMDEYLWGRIDTSIFPVYDKELQDSFRNYYEINQNSVKVKIFCDSIINTNLYFKEMEKNKYNYYIINKQNQVKIGPLSKDEFKKEFTNLNLPSTLWVE